MIDPLRKFQSSFSESRFETVPLGASAVLGVIVFQSSFSESRFETDSGRL